MNAHGFRSITVTLLLLGTSIVILAAASVSKGSASSAPMSKLVSNNPATVEH
jgi:hypothetical protein